MKRLLVLLAVLAASPVLAATYTFTGPAFSSVQSNTTCTVGTCATYTTSMNVTGSFTTAAPLAANLSNTNVAALVTSYSFNDGVNTIASPDSNARIHTFTVTTNGSGAITATQIL